MGTYLSKNNDIKKSERQELKDKTCNRDMPVSLKVEHYIPSVTKHYDNDYKDISKGEQFMAKDDRMINERCNMLPQVHIELLNYPPTTFKTSAPNKTENSSFKSDDTSDKIVDVSKLLAQLLNAKVVLEKLEEPLIKSSPRFPLTRAISAQANDDFDDKEDITRKGETNSENYARYCAKCKKTVIARRQDPIMKNCSDCKTAMTYLCTKCNVKHYWRYGYLIFHLDRCNGDETSIGQIDEDDQSELNDKDTSSVDEQIDDVVQTQSNIEEMSCAVQHHYVEKKIQNVIVSVKYSLYCPKCDKKMAKHWISKCSQCNRQLNFACKKCNAKYSSRNAIEYHLKSKCYPTYEYRCLHCTFITNIKSTIRSHINNLHTDRPSFKCKKCPHETKYKQNLKMHMEKCHRSYEKVVGTEFRCNSCTYTTNFRRNLRRHEDLCH